VIKRGKILRDASAGPGLLSVDGQHYQFAVEGVWRSAVPPTAGMAVDVDFAADATIVAITQVSDTQIAKEQAEAVVNAARQKGGVLASKAIAKFGLPLLIATGLMIISWLFLTAISVQTPFGELNFSFWQVLGFLNADTPWETVMSGRGGPSAGFYGLLAIVALAGPYASYFLKDRRASLAGILPLIFVLMVWIMFRSSINRSLGGDISGPLGDVARQAREEAMKAVSLGVGSYLSGLVTLYFAGGGVKKFLLARGLNTEVPETSKQAA
jgi:hypothetical protein